MIRALDKQIRGNYENLSTEILRSITAIVHLIKPRLMSTFLPRIQTIGKLQLLRRLVTKQIHYAAKVESAQFTNCLVTLNDSILLNLAEIKENAVNAYADAEANDLFDPDGNLNADPSITNQMFSNVAPLS